MYAKYKSGIFDRISGNILISENPELIFLIFCPCIYGQAPLILYLSTTIYEYNFSAYNKSNTKYSINFNETVEIEKNFPEIGV